MLNMYTEFTQLLKNQCNASGARTMHSIKLFQCTKELIQIPHRPPSSTVSPSSQKYRKHIQKNNVQLSLRVICNSTTPTATGDAITEKKIVQFLELA